MGLNWPHLGPRRIGPLPSLQTSAEILAPSIGTTILLVTIINFVESIRGRIDLYRKICMKIKNPCFCRNQVTPVWSISNRQREILGQFYDVLYCLLTSLIMSKRYRRALMAVANAGSPNFMPAPRKYCRHLQAAKWWQYSPSAGDTHSICPEMLSVQDNVTTTAHRCGNLVHFLVIRPNANSCIFDESIKTAIL